MNPEAQNEPRGVMNIDDTADASPVVQQVNEIIGKACGLGASDIHFEPAADGSLRVRLRVDGVLQDHGQLLGQAISRVKLMAGLNVAERNLPQEGRILLKVHDKDVTLLASILPTFQGEYAVLRVAPAGITITLPQIFSDEAELQKVRKLIAQPHGVVICSGPAGSGKSLLAFAMLQEPEFSKENVLSIEDPVCVPVPGVKQVEVAPQRGLTFPRAIEAAMRQDPDVLLIGEVRDLETAQAAIQAALSGHLVIAVMNAATPLAVVRTLREMGVAPFQMSAAVIGIISQRLVQKLCPNCRTWAASPTKGVPPEVAEFLRQHRQAEIYVSKGCANCGGSGYKGRVSIHSILVPDDGFRDAVAASADAAILLAAARKAGMKSLLTSGLEKVVAGLTSVEKAWQVAWDDR